MNPNACAIITPIGDGSGLTERISFAEFDASVQGWANHVRYADGGGLRRHVLAGLHRRAEDG